MKVNLTESITGKNFQSDIVKNKTKTLVLFGSKTCRPCDFVKKRLQEALDKKEYDLNIEYVDVQKNTTLANKYNIKSVPTLLLFDSGKVAKSKVGNLPMAAIEELLGS